MRPPEQFSRIVIENVYPELDGGRFPIKRVVGDVLGLWADIFMDGHDKLGAVLCYGAPGKKQWEEIPLVPLGNDRWHATVRLLEVGLHRYTVTAWPDVFGSWLDGARKKLQAGQDITLEIQEGRALLETLFGKRPGGAKRDAQQLLLAMLKETDPGQALQRLESDEALAAVALAARPGAVTYKTLEVWVDRKEAEYSAWYEIVPRSQGTQPGKSATFADCERRLPDIKAMGFDVVYLTPIHPIGVTHRKGKNNSLKAEPGDPGSPYAIGSKDGGHKAVHKELGTLEDFRRFVKTARGHGMEVALDFAIQCSPDHPYVKEHPEWFSFRPDGSIKYAENPPKKYEDIVNVNFAAGAPLWEELASIVRFWIEQGVTIFRVDNPHTKPFAFWQWLIESIRAERPDIIFLSEAFTRPKIMYQLAKLGFTQSYSYFTWRNTKTELTEYLTELTTDWPKDYFRPNFFANTPDIFPSYLQTGGRAGYIIRFVLAATLGGNYGIYNGYELCEGEPVAGKEEYKDSEKYEYKVRDWNAPGNIKDIITRVNRIRAENPALQHFKNLRFHPSTSGQVLFYSKTDLAARNAVFVAVNLDPHTAHDTYIDLPLDELGIAGHGSYELEDLLLGHSWRWTGARQHLRLDPKNNPVAIFRLRNWQPPGGQA